MNRQRPPLRVHIPNKAQPSPFVQHVNPLESVGQIFDLAQQMEALLYQYNEAYKNVLDIVEGIKKGDDGYTPIKGKDYFDGNDGYTPVKGKDYFDGINANPEDVVPLVLAKIPKMQPQKIDTEAIKRAVLASLPFMNTEKEELDHEKLLGSIKGKIKPEPIDGLQQTLHAMKTQLDNRGGYIHGGGDTVDAGTNIVITNVNGKKVISSTGGGGGVTYLPATEIPDGSITVFTFATATAKPSYIWRDYAKYPEVRKDGTILWSWNNGAKTVTLVNIPAPQEDLEGQA